MVAAPTAPTREDIDPALVALSGTVLDGRYQVGRMLGAGGMGAVFEATHMRLERKVAIKVLRPVFVGHEEFIQRFLREAKATSKIRQRNVVEILDYGEAEGGIVYSVMELLDGQDLGQLLACHPEQRLPWEQACGLLAQIAAGLKAAHAHGVIHRDIKPANCFLSREDDEVVVKVVDFGIAKDVEAGDTHRLTSTAEILGTPAYIAPELVRTKTPADARSDVYSLGVLAYRMLTGRLPFTGETAFELLHRTCFEEVVPLRAYVPELAPEVDAFVLSMLAKDPAQRPQDMGAVREGLFALARQTPGMQPVLFPGSGPLPMASTDGHSASMAMRTTPLPLSAADLIAAGRPPAPVVGPTEVLLTPASIARPDPSHGAPPPVEPAFVPGLDSMPGRVPSGPYPALDSMSGGVPSGAHPAFDSMSGRVPSGPYPAFDSMPGRIPSGPYPTLETRGFGEESTGPRPGAVEPTPTWLDETEEEPPRRKGWILAGSLAALVVGGGVGLWIVMAGAPEAADPDPAPVAAGVAKPKASPATEVPGSQPESESQPLPEPQPLPDSQPLPDAQLQPEPQPEPQPESQPESQPEPQPESQPEPARPSREGESGRPRVPSDASIIKKLKKTIRTRCPDLPTQPPLTVSFLIQPSGQLVGVTATPGGVPAKCAMAQVKGASFSPRAKNKPITFTVSP